MQVITLLHSHNTDLIDALAMICCKTPTITHNVHSSFDISPEGQNGLTCKITEEIN